MRTSWPDERIDRFLAARNPQPAGDLAGSERAPDARALLHHVLSFPPDADPVSTPAAAPPRRRRRRAVVGGVTLAGAAAAAAALVFTAALPGSPVRPTSAAAAVLDRAARAAAEQPIVGQLLPGQYLYSEAIGNGGNYFIDDDQHLILTEYTQRLQRWVAANGSGRTVSINYGPERFETPHSRQVWIQDGRPAQAVAMTRGTVVQDYAPNTCQPTAPCVQSGDELPDGAKPLDVAAFPTAPAALLQVIEEGKTGDPDFSDPKNYVDVFQDAVGLLDTPEVGVTPAFRSALYQIMAGLNGDELLGPVTDRSGQSGVGVAGPEAHGWREEIVIDPATGAVLQDETVIVDPAAETTSAQEYYGTTAGTVIGWTDFLASGVVDSVTATPPGTGAG